MSNLPFEEPGPPRLQDAEFSPSVQRTLDNFEVVQGRAASDVLGMLKLGPVVNNLSKDLDNILSQSREIYDVNRKLDTTFKSHAKTQTELLREFNAQKDAEYELHRLRKASSGEFEKQLSSLKLINREGEHGAEIIYRDPTKAVPQQIPLSAFRAMRQRQREGTARPEDQQQLQLIEQTMTRAMVERGPLEETRPDIAAIIQAAAMGDVAGLIRLAGANVSALPFIGSRLRGTRVGALGLTRFAGVPAAALMGGQRVLRQYSQSRDIGMLTGEDAGAGFAAREFAFRQGISPFDMLSRDEALQIQRTIRGRGVRGQLAEQMATAIGDLHNDLGVPVEQLAEAMVKATREAGLTVQEFGDQMQELDTVARTTGLGVTELAAALPQLVSGFARTGGPDAARFAPIAQRAFATAIGPAAGADAQQAALLAVAEPAAWLALGPQFSALDPVTAAQRGPQEISGRMEILADQAMADAASAGLTDPNDVAVWLSKAMAGHPVWDPLFQNLGVPGVAALLRNRRNLGKGARAGEAAQRQSARNVISDVLEGARGKGPFGNNAGAGRKSRWGFTDSIELPGGISIPQQLRRDKESEEEAIQRRRGEVQRIKTAMENAGIARGEQNKILGGLRKTMVGGGTAYVTELTKSKSLLDRELTGMNQQQSNLLDLTPEAKKLVKIIRKDPGKISAFKGYLAGQEPSQGGERTDG